MSYPDYITPSDLAHILSSSTQKNNIILIIDVRDEDFKFGNIPGCRNIPSHVFLNNLNSNLYVKEWSTIPHIVFHCALSQGKF